MKNDRRTPKLEVELRLRIVLVAPPAGVDFGIQEGKGSEYKTIQKQRSKEKDAAILLPYGVPIAERNASAFR